MERDSKRKKRSTPEVDGLGYFGVPRKVNGSKTDYQPYRLSVIELWTEQAPILFDRYKPDMVVAEIVPPVGSGNFVVATQSQLALCAITTIQAIAIQREIPISQISATTVKTRIGGNKKASKVKVRNGVFKIIPELEDYKKEWVSMFDISDAVAVGLTHWEYDNRG